MATLQVSYRRERRSVRPIRADGRVVSKPTSGERLFAWGRAPLLSLLGRFTARLADAIPLAPVEGKLPGIATSTEVMAVGEPGHAILTTFSVRAKVIAVDYERRTLSLLGDGEFTETVQVSDAAVNFDQVRVGDELELVLPDGGHCFRLRGAHRTQG